MISTIIGWAVSSWQNVVLLLGLSSSLVGVVYWFVKDKVKDFKHAREKKKLAKQRDIANEPTKRGDDLIDGL